MIKNKISYLLAASAVVCATGISAVGAEEVSLAESQNVETLTETTNMEKATPRIASTGTVINAPEGLNFRRKPSTDSSSEIMRLIPNNTTVTLTGLSNGWYSVYYDGLYGYVSATYIRENTTTSSSTDTAYSATGKVYKTDGEGLSLRQSATTSSTRLALIPEGTTLTITAKNGSWYKTTYGGKTGYVHADYVNIQTTPSNSDVAHSGKYKIVNTDGEGLSLRQSATTSSTRLALIPEGTVVTVTAKNGSWYKTSYNGKTGYIHSDYTTAYIAPTTPSNGDVAYNETGRVVNTDYEGLSLRQSASTSSTRLALIPEGTVITITAKNGSWYKTTYGGKTGYVHSDYVKIGVTEEVAPPVSESKYETVLRVMKAQIGSPYVWGGSGEYITYDSIAALKKRFPVEAANGDYDYILPQYYNSGYRAFDCSGLMQWSFAQAGISIGRTTYAQVYDGVGVSINNAQPGDLLLYSDLSHVAMYIGNNQMIESPLPGGYIKISSVPWNKIGYVRRVL